MLSTTALCIICLCLGLIFGAAFVSLDLLMPKALRAFRSYQRKQSAKRLLAIAFRDPMHS